MNHDLAIDQNPKSVAELRAIFSAYLNDLFAILHDERSRKFPVPVLQYALGLEDHLCCIVGRFFDKLDRLADLCVFPHGEVWAPVTLNILVAAQKILCSAMQSELSLHADDTLTADPALIALTDIIQREANASCFFYTTTSAQQPSPDLSTLDVTDHDDHDHDDPQNSRRCATSAGQRSVATHSSTRSRVPLARRTSPQNRTTLPKIPLKIRSPGACRIPLPADCRVRSRPLCPVSSSSGLSPPSFAIRRLNSANFTKTR